MLVLEVVESVAALALARSLEVGQEIIVGGVPGPKLLHRDKLLVFDEEHAVTVPATENISSPWTYNTATNCTYVLLFLISSNTFLQSSAIATPEDMISFTYSERILYEDSPIILDGTQ